MATIKRTAPVRRPETAVKHAKVAGKRGEIHVTDPVARAMIEANGLEPGHLEELHAQRDRVIEALPALVEEFYARVMQDAEMRAILTRNTSIDKQRPRLEAYLRALFDGKIDDAFVQHRQLVGRVHDRIDLPASYFIMMYAVLQKHLLGAGNKLRGEAWHRYEDAVLRILRVDMGIVLTTFDDARRTRISDVVESRLKPIDRVMGVIELGLDGTILEANENFLKVVGYTLDELKGRHHRMFCEPEWAASSDYADFWAALARGQIQTGEYRRVGKGGKTIWLFASYNPVFDRSGKVVRVAKFATDVTAEKTRNADYESQLKAIHKSVAVVELAPDGTILAVNENFQQLLGYGVDEVKGRHHRMLVDATYGNSAEYAEFWRQLADGRFQEAELRRVAKGGREVWMRASYNPVAGLNGKTVKIVKFASDITATKQAQMKQEELSREVERNRVAAEAFLDEAGSVLERLSERQLDVRVEGVYEGSYDRLKGFLNAAIENLDSALSQVTAAATEVSTACGEITGASQSLAQATSRSAGTIEEVTSNLQEMASMSSQNARNSQEARTLADSARTSAEKGLDNMQRLSQSIEKIKASSDETAKIVKTIDDIAFQTNLLALNAAVEAARAGDAGRGFAVVAEEVRNLAMRSAEAARMTAQMIDGSVKNAEEGVQFNKEVFENLGEITSRVRRVGEVMQEIAAASETQSQTVAQVNESMDELSKLTQQNAATSEETASAAEELTGQANGLIAMVEAFALTGAEAAAPPPPPARRPALAPRPVRPRPASIRPAAPQRAAAGPRIPAPRAPRAPVAPAAGPGKSPAIVFPLDDEVFAKF